jgi:carbonic anhydrase/acetyltransferase-like protein (isoleucine patch superfamily)
MSFAFLAETPEVHPSAFIAPGAVLISAVRLGAQSSVWFNSVLRGDVQRISIGARTNIQDGTIVHCSTGGQPTVIGDDVSIGHGAILHSCTIEDTGFVGFGARVLDRAIVRGGGMLAAGAVLTPGKIVGAGELWAGNPAKLLRPLTPEESLSLTEVAERYVSLAESYRTGAAHIVRYREN